MLTDTHAHLQMSDFDPDRDEVITRSVSAGVNCIINASFDLPSSHQAVKLAEEHDNFYAAVGVHPHDAKTLNDDVLSALRTLAKHPKVIAIGETGLDYYRNLSPRDVQRSAFERQIELAQEIGLPIVVHNRDAHEDIIRILGQHQNQLRGVMHCFSGDREFADKCLRMGFYISFAGTITYTSAHKLREVVVSIPQDKLLVETDCPYLAPQFKRGERNEPAYLRAIVKKIAELRHTTFPEIGEITTTNAKSLFGLDQGMKGLP